MAITYSINGGNEIHGVESDWQRQPVRQNADGTTDFNDWSLNIWQLAEMDMAEFETIRALQGTALTSLETNDIDDRNVAATYTTVILTGVVNGQQIGRRMTNVTLTFRVDTTA